MQNIFIDVLPPWVETGLQPAFYDLESGTVLQQTARMYAKVRELTVAFNTFTENVTNEINTFEQNTNDEIKRFEGVVNDTVEEYIGKFNDLHDYVEDYFENLDVQEEINNKLDDMLESGQLQEIIDQFVQSNVAWTFDSVADMQSSTNLIEGSFAQTTGYYTSNDQGGGIYQIIAHGAETIDGGKYIALSDSLTAMLITENDSVSVRQYGAYGDGTHDDTTAIQNALNAYTTVTMPDGHYKVTDTITMPFNKNLIGSNRASVFVDVPSDLENKYIIKYGSTVTYGQETGLIKNITFAGPSDQVMYSYGIQLNSGIVIDNCYFRYLKQALSKGNNAYTDVIRIIRTSFSYCYNTENKYVIDLASNSDGLEIDQCKFITAYSELTYNNYIGMHISYCGGGSITNSIINAPVFIEYSKALTIDGCHFEGDSDTAGNNLSSIRILDSNVSIRNCYLHKRSNGSNFIIEGSAGMSHEANNVVLENICILYTSVFMDLIQDTSTIYDIEKGVNSTLQIKNCFSITEFSAYWTSTPETYGIRIKNLPEFNQHSSVYSYNCFIGINNNILTDVTKIKPNDQYAVANFLSGSASNTNIPWYESGYNNTTQCYEAIYVLDENRKLALFSTYNGTGNTVTGITTGNMSSANKKGVLIRNAKSLYADGLGAYLYIYRGNSNKLYDKLTKVSACASYYLIDMGTNISGFPTADREASDKDTFTYVSEFSTDGQNVTFHASTYPSIGTFVKGDHCINTNITAGGVKGWIYNGANWVSEGNYPS